MAKRSHLETIEDITGGCKERCILKLCASRFWDDRKLKQVRCVGYYKDYMEERDKKKYEFEDALKLWDENCAAKFAEVYKKNSELEAKQIYDMVMRNCEKG